MRYGGVNSMNQTIHDSLKTERIQTQSQSRETPSSKDSKSLDSQPLASKPSGGGLFGGLLSKLVPGAGKIKSNQAILPDDKKPTIVWDEVSKQWVDKNADPNERQANQAVMNGPPKIPMMPMGNTSVGGTNSGPQFQFKPMSAQGMSLGSSGSGMKKHRYVDVFNTKAWSIIDWWCH